MCKTITDKLSKPNKYAMPCQTEKSLLSKTKQPSKTKQIKANAHNGTFLK